MYVIKFNKKYYWCGYNQIDVQLRKAVIYASLKMAKQTAEDCLKRKEVIRKFSYLNEDIITYDIVEIELKEKKII